MPKKLPVSEGDILARVVSKGHAGLKPATARALMDLRFDETAQQRIRRLLRKNNVGTITTEERLELDKYLRVGMLLDLLHATAQLTLHRNGNHE